MKRFYTIILHYDYEFTYMPNTLCPYTSKIYNVAIIQHITFSCIHELDIVYVACSYSYG